MKLKNSETEVSESSVTQSKAFEYLVSNMKLLQKTQFVLHDAMKVISEEVNSLRNDVSDIKESVRSIKTTVEDIDIRT